MWVRSALWAGIGTFVQVFVLWSLNAIATELENPFGEDVNDLPAQQMQQEMNQRLLLLIRPSTQRTARLSEKAVLEESLDENGMSLPKKKGLGKAGVAGVARPDSRLHSRRISLGQLQAAIADQALVSIDMEEEEEEAEPEAMEKTDSNGSAPLPPRATKRKATKKITIRDMSAAVGDLAGGTFKRSVSAVSQIGEPTSPVASRIMDQKFMLLQEGLARDIAELVAIGNELRSSSRTLGNFGLNPPLQQREPCATAASAVVAPWSPGSAGGAAAPPDPADYHGMKLRAPPMPARGQAPICCAPTP
eukprot:CAMPEP_0170324652 /NCGR_PEP_ID=MMETSP0116_2-20130129/63169_1 /TAXON_ID=400756 /ORGANISM="Durinskia baltica, Strain CSIRO CS-38" /LENGTH=304 /DNA_ID=CAMNT_0010577641 /DNA_START=57 /DNA_END=969 /DNA_ORIENTATION=-